MRYLLQNEFCQELFVRKAYIFRTLSLWTAPPIVQGNFITLGSIPNHALDLLFIVGHNYMVSKYLSTQNIQESTIIIISCRKDLLIPEFLIKNKTLYISKQNKNGESLLLKGSAFKFPFDPTESELMFFNNRNIPDIPIRLKQAFQRIK